MNKINLKKYFYVALAIIICVLFIASYNIFKEYEKNVNHKIVTLNKFIKFEIDDMFQQNTNILKYLGNDIVQNNEEKNLKELSNKLINLSNIHIVSMTESYVSWANPEGIIIVSGKQGILKTNFPDITKRSYYVRAKNNPWTLQIAKSDRSLFSSVDVIPTAMGICDRDNNFIGFLVLGLRVNSILEKFDKMCDHLELTYLILDGDYNNVFMSNKKNYKEIIDFRKLLPLVDEGFLKKKISIEDINYEYLSKTKNEHYSILIGIKNSNYVNGIISLFLYKIFEIFIISSFILMLIFNYVDRFITCFNISCKYALQLSKGITDNKLPKPRISQLNLLYISLLAIKRLINKKIKCLFNIQEELNIMKQSDKFKEEYIIELGQHMNDHAIDIINLSNKLIENFQKNIDIKIKEEQVNKHLEHIKYNATVLKLQTYTKLNLSYFNINDIIEKSFYITMKTAYLNNVKLEKELENIPFIYADKFLLNQLFTLLINNSIKNSPTDSIIKIKSLVLNNENSSCFQVVIKDNGFGFSKEEINRITNKNNLNNDISFIYNSVQNIIDIHNGKIKYNSEKYVGSEIVITLPVNQQERTKDQAVFQNNIYKLNTF